MTYGIKITPDDGGKPVILDGARYISSLGSVTMTTGKNSIEIRKPPEGSEIIVVPRSLIKIKATHDSEIPIMGYVYNYSVNGSTFNYEYYASKTETGWFDFSGDIGIADIFSISGTSIPGNSYGIRISNGSDFMNIADTSYLGFVTWRGVVNINGSWVIPSDIVNLGDYIVFANWDDSSTPIFLNRNNNSIECYINFNQYYGSDVGGSVSNVKIVIVSCGFSPPIPDSGYGFIIRNASGNITYSSKYAPVKWNGSYYYMPAYSNVDTTTGEVLYWSEVTGYCDQPMVPLCSIGFQRGDHTRHGETYSFRPLLYTGFKMSGGRISSARASPAHIDANVSFVQKAMQVPCNIPCIDAGEYF